MADFLGMAWKVVVIGLIVVAALYAVSSFGTIITQTAAAGGQAFDRFNFTTTGQGAFNAGDVVRSVFGVTAYAGDSSHPSIDWPVFLLVLGAIPAAAVSVMALRFLVRGVKA